jgi:hypothetical protein
MLRHCIDGVKLTARVHRCQHGGRHSLATTKVAPCKSAFARRRHEARYDSHVVEPGRRQFVNESAHIRDIRNITLDLNDHRSLPRTRSTAGMTAVPEQFLKSSLRMRAAAIDHFPPA